MSMKTLSARERERELTANEPFRRAETFAKDVEGHCKAKRLHTTSVNNVKAGGLQVDIIHKERTLTVTALPGGEWKVDGMDRDDDAVLDAVSDFLAVSFCSQSALPAVACASARNTEPTLKSSDCPDSACAAAA